METKRIYKPKSYSNVFSKNDNLIKIQGPFKSQSKIS